MSNLDRLRILATDYRLEYEEMTDDIGSWKLDENLNPVVVVDPRIVDKTFELNESDFYKFYFDPFFGFFSHEHNEALVTMKLIRGDISSVLFDYPKAHIRKIDLDLLEKITNPEERILALVGHQVQDWHKAGVDSDNMCFCCQMISHEVITSHDPEEYYKWIDQTAFLSDWL